MLNTLNFLTQSYPLLSGIWFGFLCLSIGSFLNVVIYRLPMVLSNTPSISLSVPRSFCPACKTTLPWYRNIPLLSFGLQKGKCHRCKHQISYVYPLVEALTLVLSWVCFIVFGVSLKLVFALIFVWFMIVLTFIDVKHYILPDVLTLSLLWIGLIANSFDIFCSLSMSVYGALLGYLLPWIFIKIYFWCTQKIGMGNGDFKLIAAFGAFFGPSYLPFILFFASLLGAVLGLIYLKTQKLNKHHPIPFGPFLCTSALLMLGWGEKIINFYTHFLVT